jgi:hypothetical protein
MNGHRQTQKLGGEIKQIPDVFRTGGDLGKEREDLKPKQQ